MMGYISEGHKRHVWCARGVGEGATTPGSPASVTSESEGAWGGGQTLSIQRRQHMHAQTPHGYRQTDRSTCNLRKP